MRRFESAIADFTEAIRLKPDFALAYAIANWQISSSAITTKPLVDYSIALDRDPKLAYCHLDRGSLYLTWATTRRRSTISPRPWPGNPAIPSA